VLTAHRDGETVTTEAALVPLKRQTLAETVAHAIDAAGLADPEAWRKAANELVKLLPAGVFDRMAAAPTLLVVPDDMLWRVPFEALPSGAGYLLDGTQVVYAASVTARVRARSGEGEPPAFRVAAAVAPDVPATVIETLKNTAPTWVLRSADAAAAGVARLEGTLGVEALHQVTGAAATEDALRTAASAASVLHVEGPFRVNAASPAFSSILLAVPPPAEPGDAPPPPPASNGVVEAREVPSAGWTTRVAVFADPASLSMRDSASALPALHWIWHAGGTDALLVRRWGGDEATAADLLAAFYAALKEGQAPADALHTARAAVRNANPSLPPAAWAAWLALSVR
jgi:hypothetical protein